MQFYIQLQCPVRTQKIGTAGDHWEGQIKPNIRLIGDWCKRFRYNPEATYRSNG